MLLVDTSAGDVSLQPTQAPERVDMRMSEGEVDVPGSGRRSWGEIACPDQQGRAARFVRRAAAVPEITYPRVPPIT